METKIKNEQNAFETKIQAYERDIKAIQQDGKNKIEKLEIVLNEREKENDELKQDNLKLDSQLKLLNSEFKNCRQKLDDQLYEYKVNHQKDLEKIKELRDELNQASNDITLLRNELNDTKEKHKYSENKFIILEKELENNKIQLQNETELKREFGEKLEALKETLKVSQNENDTLQFKLDETKNTMDIEIDKLKTMMNTQQNTYEQRYRRSIEEKNELEGKLNTQMVTLERNLFDHKKQFETVNEEYQKVQAEKQRLESQVKKLTADKQSLEDSFGIRYNDQNKKLSDLENKLKAITEKYESAKNELIKIQNYNTSIENDLKSKNSEILNAHEKYNLLEMDRITLMNELEDSRRMLHLESVEKKEKLRQIEDLNESLSSSHLEIEKLKNVNDQLNRSLEDGDNLRHSLMKNCNELRETLAEVEKSRLEIKSKLNNCQFNCASLNNHIRKNDLEIDDLKRKLSSYEEEKKFWQQDLDSTGQSLTQMKSSYDRLYQQNILLQNKLSQMETESNHKLIDTKNNLNGKDSLKKLSQECEQLRERIAKLESEKKHFERMYINLEKEHNNMKNSFGTNYLNDTHLASPNSAPTRKTFNDNSLSVLQLTQLLQNDITNANPFTLNDTNRSLETLRQKNIELKQKVLGRQIRDDKLNTNKLSADCCECLHHHQNYSNNNNNLDDDLYFDENRNIDFDHDNSFDEKLKVAELNAQKVLDSCEPEV